MEPMIKTWYENLKDGKLFGTKCKKCGAVEFPPVPACSSCGNLDVEPVEISGKGELLSFSFSPMGIPPYHMRPVIVGFTRLHEGPMFCSEILNVSPAEQEDLFKRLQEGPVEVTYEAAPMNDEISYPKIRVCK